MGGWIEFIKGLNGKKGPIIVVAIMLAAQTTFQIAGVWFGQKAAVGELGEKLDRNTKEIHRTIGAVNTLSAYIQDGVMTKADAGYLWRKREREEIVPMTRRISRLERKAGLMPEASTELGIDLPNWDESQKPPSVWLDAKASGE